MPKRNKAPKTISELENGETLKDNTDNEIEGRKGEMGEVTKELKNTFNLPKFGLKNRTMTVMTRIDETSLKVIDALVAFDLVPSRSSGAAYLIDEAIRNNEEKYLKILESYDTIKQAKKKAQYSFYKSLQEENEDLETDEE